MSIPLIHVDVSMLMRKTHKGIKLSQPEETKKFIVAKEGRGLEEVQKKDGHNERELIEE